MLTLGPIASGPRRGWPGQVQGWLAYLDGAQLFWWHVQKDALEIVVARERLSEGAVPSSWLVALAEEGMTRVSRRVPYVAWGAGPLSVSPARRVAGLWPRRDALSWDMA